VILAGALSVGPITYFKSLRFQTVLGEKIPGMSSILIATRTFNSFLPARVGEAYRILACHRRSGCSKRKVLLSIAAESLVEIFSFVVIGAWVAPLYWPKIPSWIAPVLLVIVLFLGLFLRRRWIKSVFLTLLSDLTDAAMVGCCLVAAGVELSPLKWCAVLVTINLVTLIPFPGNLGTLEAGAVFGLGVFGVDRTTALEFALLYRAAHTVPIVGAYLLTLAARVSSDRATRTVEARLSSDPG
jgi:uncharacterized membrane protein YbhN (UPF0104 family)